MSLRIARWKPDKYLSRHHSVYGCVIHCHSYLSLKRLYQIFHYKQRKNDRISFKERIKHDSQTMNSSLIKREKRTCGRNRLFLCSFFISFHLRREDEKYYWNTHENTWHVRQLCAVCFDWMAVEYISIHCEVNKDVSIEYKLMMMMLMLMLLLHAWRMTIVRR